MNVFEFENNSGTQLNIQMTWLVQDISQINHESRINNESQFNPNSRINYPIRINYLIPPTFNTPFTRPTENTPPTRPTENNHQNIQMTRPDQDVSWVNPGSRINPDSQINLESQINCLIRINSPIRPTFNIPLTRCAGRRISRHQDNFYIAYNFYLDQNLQAIGEIILRQRDNF